MASFIGKVGCGCGGGEYCGGTVEGVDTVEAPCRRVHSPMEDFYSPLWTCMF